MATLDSRDDEARDVPDGSDSRSGRALDGSAWRDLCEALARAGEVILRDGSPTTPLDRAEGFRYLSRLARLALEKFVENADPSAPSFYRLSHETAKIGCDNPDSFYQNAEIDGRYEYRLRGTRGSVAYLGLGTYYGAYGKAVRSGCSGYLEGDQLEVAADGSFEVALSSERRPGNWLPMEPDTCMLIVRQNFLDRENERPAALSIERVRGPGEVAGPAPLDPARLAGAFRDAGAFVHGTAALFADWAEGFAAEPNVLSPMDPARTGGAHGDPNIFFHMGYWRLLPDEALVIDLEPPACEYWNFQLNNHWMESLDYRHHTIHLNKHTARAREDGRVRIVVAHEDPGVPNWIETAGHDRGTMGLRWVKAASHPTPPVRLVKRADVTAA